MPKEYRNNVIPFKNQKSVLRVNALGDIGEIDLFGVVGGSVFLAEGEETIGISKEKFAKELKKISRGVKRIDMRISSPGGDVFDGRAIANMIKEHPAKFDMNIVAEASSVASIIAMSGDTIRMAEGAVMLIHRCFAFTIGNAKELTATARDLTLIDDTMVATYAKRTGMKAAEILALMDENRYMSAEEAKKLGFVDAIATTTPLRVAAMNIDRKRFHLPPLPENVVGNRTAALTALNRIKLSLG